MKWKRRNMLSSRASEPTLCYSPHFPILFKGKEPRNFTWERKGNYFYFKKLFLLRFLSLNRASDSLFSLHIPWPEEFWPILEHHIRKAIYASGNTNSTRNTLSISFIAWHLFIRSTYVEHDPPTESCWSQQTLLIAYTVAPSRLETPKPP